MAEIVLTNAKVLIGATDLSDHVKHVTINYKADTHDNSAMGMNTHSKIAGLKDWSMDIEFFQDFAASNVDATLFPLVGTTFTVEVRPVNAARSATNPGYNGTGLLESYPPLGGNVGDLATTRVTIQAAGDLSRSTV